MPVCNWKIMTSGDKTQCYHSKEASLTTFYLDLLLFSNLYKWHFWILLSFKILQSTELNSFWPYHTVYFSGKVVQHYHMASCVLIHMTTKWLKMEVEMCSLRLVLYPHELTELEKGKDQQQALWVSDLNWKNHFSEIGFAHVHFYDLPL